MQIRINKIIINVYTYSVILQVVGLFNTVMDLVLHGLSRMLLHTSVYIVVINLTCQDCVIMCRPNYYVYVLAVTLCCIMYIVCYCLKLGIDSNKIRKWI